VVYETENNAHSGVGAGRGVYASQIEPAEVDVVVVSYNSAGELRRCVEPLSEASDIRVIVVDNASSDGSVGTISDLPVSVLETGANLGFARGSNLGWRSGSAPFVLFLNPDAAIDPESIARLRRTLSSRDSIGAVGPRIVGDDGHLHHSQRRFARLRSTYAQALFLHRVLPWWQWTDEVVRDVAAYEAARAVEWLSGASLMVRRSTLEQLGGFDERFFLYCEDMDLCFGVHRLGLEVRFDPGATAIHVGGASAPTAQVIPLLAASRSSYAYKHRGAIGAAVERLGVALGDVVHAAVGRGDADVRKAHLVAARAALRARS
jgi:N-acetylglucosaminyl-diphospho-decaprenol L-rhamnosyltransferase